MTIRARLVRSVPPLARRDAELVRRRDRINELTTQVGRLERDNGRLGSRVEALGGRVEALGAGLADAERRADLTVPSFWRQLGTLQRTQVDLRSLDPQLHHPLRHLPFKLRNYRLARSHGIAVPAVLQVWSTVPEMSFEQLPDAFVVKSDGGAGSHGVLPLRRVAADQFETVDGTRRLAADDVREHFATRQAAGRISGPYFAEELLVQPGGGPIPDDIKLYAMYGEVAMVYVRRVGVHGDLSSVSRRYLADDGTDLGDALDGYPSDADLPEPAHLAQVVDIGRHLSRAVGLPFVRVDLYATEGGPVLGELTRAPGGPQRFRPDQEEAMGRAWEQAVYRLDLDLLAGRPPGVLHGEHPAANPYPQDHVSRSVEAGAWEPVVVPCERCKEEKQPGAATPTR